MSYIILLILMVLLALAFPRHPSVAFVSVIGLIHFAVGVPGHGSIGQLAGIGVSVGFLFQAKAGGTGK
jgi:apolipoprotein N-acyltransferase